MRLLPGGKPGPVVARVAIISAIICGFAVCCWITLRIYAALDGRIYAAGQLEYEVKSDFSHIRIRKTGDVRTLLFVDHPSGEIVESAVDLEKPYDLVVPYTRYMFASYLFRPKHESVLVVGLGGGAMIHFLRHYDPQLRIDVVEIDPVVVKIADEYFGIRSSGNLRIVTADAFEFLRATDVRYDVIYMDAFLRPSDDTDESGTPKRLQTLQFLKDMQRALAPDGLVVFNLHTQGSIKEDTKSIRDAFPHTYTFWVPLRGNRVAIAPLNETKWSREDLEQRAEKLEAGAPEGYSFIETARRLMR